MFSRRHPLLFSFLVFSALTSGTLILLSLIIALGMRGSDLAGLDMGRGEKVGVIEITGVIADARDILAQLKGFREDGDIKAIVIRVDSPGGVVGPSQEIYREVMRTRSTKKVIASMGAVAASGGYYVIAGADGIMANPGTITGSIGVIMEYTNFEELFQKIGLSPVVIKSGKFKDAGSPVRKMTPEEERILKDFVDRLHQQFVAAIAEGRQMDLATVQKLADGRIYTGADAKEIGLVDRIGNMEDAIDWAGELAGIEGDIIPVYPPPKKLSVMRLLTESFLGDLIGRVTHQAMTAEYRYTPSHP
jgi:protease IV